VNGSVGRVIGFGFGETTPTPGISATAGLGSAAQPNSSAGPSHLPAPPEQVQVPWPRVRFLNGIERICTPEEFTINNPFGEVEARRRQVTLKPLFTVQDRTLTSKLTQGSSHTSVGA